MPRPDLELRTTLTRFLLVYGRSAHQRPDPCGGREIAGPLEPVGQALRAFLNLLRITA